MQRCALDRQQEHPCGALSRNAELGLRRRARRDSRLGTAAQPQVFVLRREDVPEDEHARDLSDHLVGIGAGAGEEQVGRGGFDEDHAVDPSADDDLGVAQRDLHAACDGSPDQHGGSGRAIEIGFQRARDFEESVFGDDHGRVRVAREQQRFAGGDLDRARKGRDDLGLGGIGEEAAVGDPRESVVESMAVEDRQILAGDRALGIVLRQEQRERE